ncbi:MAG TPA: tetratricopeptide repeat protein [Allosphingosinicella sp.]|nr:tetratricopeptide repeat protein [Allosphingosinicella sp.]
MRTIRIALLIALAFAAVPAVARPVRQDAAGTRWGVDRTDLASLTGDVLLAKAGFASRVAQVRAAAESGDRTAMTLLSAGLLGGVGVPVDEAESRLWAERAAALGEPRALRILGVIHALGLGVPVDKPTALAILERARAAGSRIAAADMASLLANGEGGVTRDRVRAVALAREAVAGGVVYANGELALAYLTGGGVAQDYAAARAAAWLGAEADDPLSEHILANIYSRGRGVQRDSHLSNGLLERAALDGGPEALTAIGWNSETLALVRRWGPYARITNRRLNDGRRFYNYRWHWPGRDLRLDYRDPLGGPVREIVFTWPAGAVAPVSSHPAWRMRLVDGVLHEEVDGVLVHMTPTAQTVTRTRLALRRNGRPGAVRGNVRLTTLPLDRWRALNGALNPEMDDLPDWGRLSGD